MSLSPQTLHRLPQIKTGLLRGDNYPTIGASCGVKEKTIDRDIKAWLESGDFEAWIKEEWIRLHGKIVTENPDLAYKEITRLVAKMVTRKTETEMKVKAEITQKEVKINLNDLTDEERKKLLDAEELLTRN